MNQQRQPIENLTNREKDVARLISQAKTDTQIAHELGLSPFSARFYVDNILFKLGLPNRVAICVWWYENIIIPKRMKEEKA